jgi:hypothetical protein
MPLDPSIILGARTPQIDLSQFSPMNAMTNVMKFKQFEQDSQLNALKIKEYERARDEEEGLRNYLRGGREMPAPDLNAPDTRSQLTQFGKPGLAYAKALSDQETAELTRKKTATDLKTAELTQAEKKLTLIGNLVAGVKDQPSWSRARARLQQLDPDQSFPEVYDPNYVQESMMTVLGAQKALEQHFTTVDLNGEKRVLAMPKYAVGGAPTTVGTFADVPLPASVEAQKTRIGQATRAVTNVQLPPQEKAEQAARGARLDKQYDDISKQASVAAKTLPSIDANLNILNKGFTTGFGTETKAAGASVLAALGVANADKFATNAQIFQAKATEAVLQKQLEQKGPQTESDAKRIDAVGAQLGKTTEGNKFLLTTAKEQLKRDMEQRNFYDAWWKKNKTYDGAEDAWFAGEGGKSLFDRPALKQYASKPQESAAAQIPTAATPARAAPAAAPIYASNPKTGQRIMSTDGGNTWTPAR